MNELDDFSIKLDQPNIYGLSHQIANVIAPGKRPLSSMTPTILLKDDKLFMLVGSPGGSTIITTVLQTIVNVIDFGMNINEAIDAPRFHMQWLPDMVYMEPYAFSKDTHQKLGFMGYHFHKHSPYGTQQWGAANAALIDPDSKTLYGGTDSRRGNSAAAGY